MSFEYFETIDIISIKWAYVRDLLNMYDCANLKNEYCIHDMEYQHISS